MLTLSILEIHFIGPNIVEFHTPHGERKGDAQRIKIPIPECTIIIVIYTYTNSPLYNRVNVQHCRPLKRSQVTK